MVVNLPGVGENLRKSRDMLCTSLLLTSSVAEDHAGIPTIFEAETPEDTMESLANPELRHKHEEL